MNLYRELEVAVELVGVLKGPVARLSDVDRGLAEYLRRAGCRLAVEVNEARGHEGADREDHVLRALETHEITRAELSALVDRGLQETRGSYRALVRLFNLPADDYKRFHAFLYQQNCNLPVGPYRNGSISKSFGPRYTGTTASPTPMLRLASRMRARRARLAVDSSCCSPYSRRACTSSALRIGMCERVVPKGQARQAAEALAHEIARFPRECMLADRNSVHRAWGKPTREAMREEYWYGQSCLKNEGVAGATRFKGGKGRHGDYRNI